MVTSCLNLGRYGLFFSELSCDLLASNVQIKSEVCFFNLVAAEKTRQYLLFTVCIHRNC